jgi:hypothetical protein
MNAAGLTPAGWVAVLVSGMLFGAGLTASTMVQPEAILAFLRWQDFGLLFVMGGAALVTGLAYAIAPRVMRKPAFATRFGVHPSRFDAPTLVERRDLRRRLGPRGRVSRTGDRGAGRRQLAAAGVAGRHACRGVRAGPLVRPQRPGRTGQRTGGALSRDDLLGANEHRDDVRRIDDGVEELAARDLAQVDDLRRDQLDRARQLVARAELERDAFAHLCNENLLDRRVGADGQRLGGRLGERRHGERGGEGDDGDDGDVRGEREAHGDLGGVKKAPV